MKNSNHKIVYLIAFVLFIPIFLFFLSERAFTSKSPEINWAIGPGKVDLGDDVAQVVIGENHLFANAEDTKKIVEYMGDIPGEGDVGMVMPKDSSAGWYIIFDYNPIGYVKDDEKDKIDAKALLKSIQKANEEANKLRRQKKLPILNVIGWYEEPHYDSQAHHLVWTILGEGEDGRKVVNYNVRLLGRHGFMSVVLVTDPSTLDQYKPEINSIISEFSYKKGKSYLEFVKGDKIAEYGLTALIMGGAGAVAAKAGLFKILAKAWKAVAAGVVALFFGLWKIIKSLWKKREDPYTLPRKGGVIK
jgi:uncharacterized membrane-anchored protein